METDQQSTPSVLNMPPPPPGIFGTRIPSTVAFAVGILLFLLPFFELNFTNIFIIQNSGLGIATGKEWVISNKGFMGNIVDSGGTISQTGVKKKDPNMYALIALALGLAGLILSFPNARSASGIAMVSAVLSACILIALWIDLKRTFNIPLGGAEDIINLKLQPTPWFYIAVIALFVAAFFCYKRMQLAKR